jgi:hypothetical protein
MIKYQKYNKYNNQNILDFVISNYGSVDYLFQFMEDSNLINSDDFYTDVRNFKLPIIPLNATTDYFNKNGIIVATDNDSDYSSELSYNNDLTFKTFVFGDFNNDFSDDFDIEEGVTVVVVGYQGMTLTVEFSINNSGNLSTEFTGVLSLDNGTEIVNKNISERITSNSTKTIKVDFPNLQYGIYDITLTSSNPVINDTKQFGVLGKPIFTYNNDLSIVETSPYSVGQTITMQWSITNSGNKDGFYQGFSRYNNVYTDINELINVSETKVFTREIVIYDTVTTFFDSTENMLDIITS